MWDTKYRPLKFSDVLGQQGSIAILKARLRNNTALDTSYLFSGGHGMGKTTLGRIHARAVLCQQLDKENPEPCNECDNCSAILNESSQAFVERDAASQGTIEHIRRIVEDLPFAVLDAPKRVYLFDECFTEDTMLVVRDGSGQHRVSIKEIVDKQLACEVLSYTPGLGAVWKEVIDWFELPVERDVIRLTFDNGAILTVTPDQELMTHNRGWVKACELSDDDDVVESNTW